METPSHSLSPTSGQEQALAACLDLHLSLILAGEISARPNHCYLNAWRAFIHRPDLFHDAWFVEGWFVVALENQVSVNEHGWIARPDGRIIDPSVLLILTPDTPVFYFPGVIRTWKEAEALEGELFPQVRFDGIHGEDGLGHAAYRAARDAARRKAYVLAYAHTPPAVLHFLRSQNLEVPTPPLEQDQYPAHAQNASCYEQAQTSGAQLDLVFSETTARTIGALPGRCWYNVRDAML
ncbi:MAG TPA: hypothetical protein VF458_03925 [Ktedonobacteraceae bacterium]